MSVKPKKNRKLNQSFVAKDFDSIRADLLSSARIFFPEKINDFSEPSVGGMFLDLAASVGDSLSFYLDHAFKEMDAFSAVEPANIAVHLSNAGLKPQGAAPASVDVTIKLTAPSENIGGIFYPKVSSLPTLLRGTTFTSTAGVGFILVQDLDFAQKTPSGKFVASYSVRNVDGNSNPTTFNVSMTGLAVSGVETIQTEEFGPHSPFVSVVLQEPSVSDIISVTDEEGNEYYEVESLSQDNVFIAVDNTGVDSELVSNNLELVPAPRRFVTTVDLTSRRTTINFGPGDPTVFDDDILPDPSEIALELFGKKVFNRFQIDPNALLRTQTLGIAPSNTTLNIRYRHGGGAAHNVGANSINQISTLRIEFRNSPDVVDAQSVRQSLRVINNKAAIGGADAPSIEGMRALIPSARNSQMRTVTKEDLLARVYSLPSIFGRIYRCAVEPNRTNPLSSLLYVCTLDSEGNIGVTPDSLKINLSTYLNEFRLISDAIDILDARVINYGIKYEVLLKQSIERQGVLETINTDIGEALNRDFFQIGQPIIIDDIVNIIINNANVVSLVNLQVFPRVGVFDGRQYSDVSFPFEENTKMGIIRLPLGGIFELRYPSEDISGTAV